MSEQTVAEVPTPEVVEIPIPLLKCMYKDCGNTWVPRTQRMPKVCPKCKRYGWNVGHVRRRRGGKKHVTGRKTAHLGPKIKQFIQQHRKET